MKMRFLHAARPKPSTRVRPASSIESQCGPHVAPAGGAWNMSNSLIVQAWSVKPAATAGVRCCQSLGEPLPRVGMGSGKGERRLP